MTNFLKLPRSLKHPLTIGIVLLMVIGISTASLLATQRYASQLPSSISNRIKFFVDPHFTQSATVAELGNRFAGYVADMNTILAKNTAQKLVFDPAKDVAVWTDPFPTGGSCSAINDGYEYWVLIQAPSSFGASNSASAGCSYYGKNEIVIKGGYWQDIWKREDIFRADRIPSGATTYIEDYFGRQLNALLHELAHTHGAGIGEYYSLGTINDTTGIAPQMNISVVTDSTGPFWGSRLAVLNDPLLRTAQPIEDYLQKAQFSPLTATIINKNLWWEFGHGSLGGAKARVPPDSLFTIQVLDRVTKSPLQNCGVTVFNQWSSGPATIIAQGNTNAGGSFSAKWGDAAHGGELHSNSNIARLFKVNCLGYHPNSDWLSTFDMQAGLLAENGGQIHDFHYNNGKLIMEMQRLPIDLALTFSCPTSASLGFLLGCTVTVKNNGPSTATNIVFSDTLPSGFTFDPTNSSNGCLQNGGNVVCREPSLLKEALKSWSVKMKVPPVAALCNQIVTNSANVISDQLEANPSDNSGVRTTTISCAQGLADLATTQTGPAKATGTSVSYTVTVTNNGPLSAANIQLSESMNPGLDFVGGDPTCKKFSPTVVTCNTFSLTAGQTRSFVLNFTIPDASKCSADFVSTANATSTSLDPIGSNNTNVFRTTGGLCN